MLRNVTDIERKCFTRLKNRSKPVQYGIRSFITEFHSFITELHSFITEFHSFITELHSFITEFHSFISKFHSFTTKFHSLYRTVAILRSEFAT